MVHPPGRLFVYKGSQSGAVSLGVWSENGTAWSFGGSHGPTLCPQARLTGGGPFRVLGTSTRGAYCVTLPERERRCGVLLRRVAADFPMEDCRRAASRKKAAASNFGGKHGGPVRRSSPSGVSRSLGLSVAPAVQTCRLGDGLADAAAQPGTCAPSGSFCWAASEGCSHDCESRAVPGPRPVVATAAPTFAAAVLCYSIQRGVG